MRFQIKVLLLVCSVVLLSTDAMLARSRQYLSTLAGITRIAYRSYFENELLSRRCEIDRYAWDAALQIVANKTDKLKLIPKDEYEAHLDVLRAKYDRLAKSALFPDDGVPAFNAAQKDLEDYNSIPKLVLSVTSIATRGGGCGGTLAAILEVDNVTPAKRIWYESRLIHYSGRDYTANVIDLAENVIKRLVSDWTYAQTKPMDAIGP